MADIEACIWMGCGYGSQQELTTEKRNERGKNTMLEIAFINEADRLLPKIAERDRETVLGILLAYVKDAEMEAKKEESSR